MYKLVVDDHLIRHQRYLSIFFNYTTKLTLLSESDGKTRSYPKTVGKLSNNGLHTSEVVLFCFFFLSFECPPSTKLPTKFHQLFPVCGIFLHNPNVFDSHRCWFYNMSQWPSVKVDKLVVLLSL